MDFHASKRSIGDMISYPIKTIYSAEARRQLRKVLDDFAPDVCHLNNFNYQLTPSIILEIVKWRKSTGRECKIIYTAHDYQLICPNHMMNNPATHENCEKCVGGHFSNCLKNKCIHGSTAKSLVGMAEAVYWNRRGTYRYIDGIICCSQFLKEKLDTNPVFAKKTIALHNFVGKAESGTQEKYGKEAESSAKAGTDVQAKAAVKAETDAQAGYVLYFGRYSWEKGVRTLIEAAKRLPDIPFVCAGAGEYEEEMKAAANITNVGFLGAEELDSYIRKARFTVCPSEWYENCPFSVMESQERGVPVVGARIGGIPELIEDGVNGALFESGDAQGLADAIRALWNDEERLSRYRSACAQLDRDDVEAYTKKLFSFTNCLQTGR
jgi:glycosyltransferase involved in cell wall biosynthesis